MAPYYHLSFVVPDLERATADLSRILGLTWNPVLEQRIDEWDMRVAFSREGPPYFEVTEGPPGSPWDASAGPRMDHLGFWVEDIERDAAELEARGAPIDIDGPAHGRPFTYHRIESTGARIELVDVSRRPWFVETWAPDDPPMEVFDPGAGG